MSITIFTTFEQVICCHEGCGVSFAMTAEFQKLRSQDHRTWYCPNGHIQRFVGKSEAEQLRDALARKEAEMAQLRASRDHAWREEAAAVRKVAAVKGQLTKAKRRAAAGVCPCCNRTFKQLASHMSDVHPDFVQEHGVPVKPTPASK